METQTDGWAGWLPGCLAGWLTGWLATGPGPFMWASLQTMLFMSPQRTAGRFSWTVDGGVRRAV